MNSIQIIIVANEEQQEILISKLQDLGVEGFEQTGNSLIAYFNQNTFKSYDVNEVFKEYSFDTTIIEEQNWNEVWESNFQPVVVNNFCAIRAEFHQPILNVEYEIIITPKMSFGTGHHATTFMMIEQMSKIDFKNKNVFDFGTGTGVLAILAEKMGASYTTAIDADDWSIENADENFAANNCTKIQLYKSSVVPQDKFDIVLANINLNVLSHNMIYISEAINKSGVFLLSGILKSDEQFIVDSAMQNNFSLFKKLERSEWICLSFVK